MIGELLQYYEVTAIVNQTASAALNNDNLPCDFLDLDFTAELTYEGDSGLAVSSLYSTMVELILYAMQIAIMTESAMNQ